MNVSKHFLAQLLVWVVTSIIRLSTMPVFGQEIVSVDHFTGRAQISIPLSTITKGEIKVPVSLDYMASGVGVSDEGEGYGLGWQLRGLGEVTRVLNDLPDDKVSCGWLYGATASLIESFTMANDSNPATCADEATDVTYLTSHFPATQDIEPDVFYVTAPGLACQVVFDKNHMPKIIPYADYTVSYTTDTVGIQSFTITKDNGMKYEFSSPDLASKEAVHASVTPVPYFSREFNAYTTKIMYYTKWYLKKITDVSGNKVVFKYRDGKEQSTVTPIEITEKNSSGLFVKMHLYDLSETIPSKRITEIIGQTNIIFDWDVTISFLHSVSLPSGSVLSFDFHTIGKGDGEDHIRRIYLKSISESGGMCNASSKFLFSYYGVNLTTDVDSLPALNTTQQDAWGYYNAIANTSLVPKIHVYPANASYPNLERYRLNPVPGYTGTSFTIAGANRSVNPNTVAFGSLGKITYSTGGSTLIQYESNSYYDDQAQTAYNGGGIRVKKIIHSDGIHTANNMVTEYLYTNPSTGQISGKLIGMPAFAFTKAYTGTPGTQAFWESSIVRVDNDLSRESTDVVYGSVTVKQTGKGKTVYRYATPATQWDAPVGDWAPSISYIGRSSCVALGDLATRTNTYPYAPNPNYEFRRGTLTSVIQYNESENKVSQTEFTYQSTSAPVIVKGLKWDELNGIKAYSRYHVLTTAAELVTSKKETVYDLQDPAKSAQIVSTFAYTGSSHKQLTKSSVTNSDGSVLHAYFKYAKDYNTSSNGDTATKALNGLKALHANPLIERYTSVVRSGTAEKVVSGELVQFQSVPNAVLGTTLYLPWQRLQFAHPDGITTFQPSQITALNNFLQDAQYVSVKRYDTYDQYGQVANESNRNKLTVAYYNNEQANVPYAIFKNARTDEVVYTGFNTHEDETYALLRSGGTIVTSGIRTGDKAFQSASTAYLQRIVKKAGALNYVFAVWIQSATAGNITCTLTSSGGTAKTYTLPYAATTTWTYYEKRIPVADMSAIFTLKVQTSTAPLLDDVLFYPTDAEVVTYTYDDLGHKLSETNSSGNTLFYEYDGFGRLHLVRDDNANILRKESYVQFNKPITVNAPYFNYDHDALKDSVNIPFTIGSANSCLAGLTYTWDFGDGSAIATGEAPTHTYTTAGTYTVTVIATHPVYGSAQYVESLTITLRSMAVQINASGVVAVDNCHQDPPLINSGGGYPSSSNRTYFNIVSINGYETTASFTYQWEMSSDNGLNWNIVGTGTSYAAPIMNLAHQQHSYKVRLKVTSSVGRTGTSNEATFIAYTSTPNCE